MRTTLVFLLVQAVMLTSAQAKFWPTVLNLLDKYQRLVDKSSPRQQLFNKSQVLGNALKLKADEAALAPYIFLGISEGLKTCGKVFSSERWNCSLQPNSFLKVVASGTKEQAFIYSFVSAGVVSEVARACAQGNLPGHCPCSIQPSTRERFYQTGCSDNHTYGHWVVQNILEPVMNEDESRRMIHMNAHNLKVGSEFVKESMVRSCVCQGSWWTCYVKICTYLVGHLSSIGEEIKLQNQSPRTAGLENSRRKRNNKLQVLVIRESPDFCVRNEITGSLGTVGRRCKGNCNKLCCSRGTTVETETKMIKDCRFVWCCRVICETKPRDITYRVCK